MYAPDAVVRQTGGLGPAAEMDQVSFAQIHRETGLRGRQVLPTFRCVAMVHLDRVPGTPEAIVWLDVAELVRERRLTVAFGLRMIEGKPRVGWCTLAARA